MKLILRIEVNVCYGGDYKNVSRTRPSMVSNSTRIFQVSFSINNN